MSELTKRLCECEIELRVRLCVWLSVREGRRRAETESIEMSERDLKMRRMNWVRLVRVLLF